LYGKYIDGHCVENKASATCGTRVVDLFTIQHRSVLSWQKLAWLSLSWNVQL